MDTTKKVAAELTKLAEELKGAKPKTAELDNQTAITLLSVADGIYDKSVRVWNEAKDARKEAENAVATAGDLVALAQQLRRDLRKVTG